MRSLLFQLVALLIAWPTFAEDLPPTKSLPFEPGERFIFDISWSHFLTAGEGILSVTDETKISDAPLYKFEIRGRTVGFIGTLYPVEDVTRSWFDVNSQKSLRTEVLIAENTFRKKKMITFDRESNVAKFQVDDEPVETFDVGETTQGPISALYIIRTYSEDLKNGKSVTVSLFDDRELYELKIKVIGKERLKLPFGEVDTIITEADLKTEGVFRRKGKMKVWFSNDDAFAPIQMSSKVIVGAIYSTLREFQGTPIKIVSPLSKNRK